MDLAHVALAVEIRGGQDLILSQAPWSNPTGRMSIYKVPKRHSHFRTFSSFLPTAALAGVKLEVKAPESRAPAQAGHTFKLISSARLDTS